MNAAADQELVVVEALAVEREVVADEGEHHRLHDVQARQRIVRHRREVVVDPFDSAEELQCRPHLVEASWMVKPTTFLPRRCTMMPSSRSSLSVARCGLQKLR